MRLSFFLLWALPLQAAVSLQTAVPKWVQEDGKKAAWYEFEETDISLYGAWEPDAAADAACILWRKNGGEAKLKGAGTLDLKGGTLVAEGAARFSVAASVDISHAAVTLRSGAVFAPASAVVPIALAWSGSGNTWSGDLTLGEGCVLLPDAAAPLTVSGTLTLNGSLTAEGEWAALFLCHTLVGDATAWSAGRYEAVTLEDGTIRLQKVQQQGGGTAGGEQSGGEEQGGGTESGEQSGGGEQGGGTESGEQGGGEEQGSGTAGGEQSGGVEQGGGTESGEQGGEEQGGGTAGSEQSGGGEQGSGTEGGEQSGGGEQGDGTESGEQGGEEQGGGTAGSEQSGGGEQGSGTEGGEQSGGGEQGGGTAGGEQSGGEKQGGSTAGGEQGGGTNTPPLPPTPRGTLITALGGVFGEEDLRLEGDTAVAGALSWAAEEAHELRGSGVLDLRGGMFRCSGGSFAVAEGISLTNGTLDVQNGAAVQAVGGTLAGVSLRWQGGALSTDSYELSTGKAITVCSQRNSGMLNTMAGDLTLNGGTFVLQGDAAQTLPYHGAALRVAGRVTLQGATEILFTIPNAEHYTEVQHIYPAEGTPVLTCASWAGDTALLSAAALWQGAVVPVSSLAFELQPMADGRTALVLKAGQAGFGNALSEQNSVSVHPNERVDLSAVRDGLSNRFISGTGGAILTTPLQTLRLSGVDTLRYSVQAAEGSEHAAALRIGFSGGQTEDTDITLCGARYDAALTELLSGRVHIGSGTTLGHDTNSRLRQYGGVLLNSGRILGSAEMHPHARFTNRGTVGGDITMAAFSVLRNEGSIGGRLTIGADALALGGGHYQATRLCRGGTLNVGRGQRHEQLETEGGARLLFPHLGSSAAPLSVGTLRAEGTADALITVTPALLSASLRPTRYRVVQAEQAEGTAAPFRVRTLDETNGLLGKVRGHWDGHTLTAELRVRDSLATAALSSAAAGVATARYADAALLRAAATSARATDAPLPQAHRTSLHGGAFGGHGAWGDGLSARHSYSGVTAGAEHGLTDALSAGLHVAAAHSDFRDSSLRSKADAALAAATLRTERALSAHWSFLADAYLTGGQLRHRGTLTPQARLSASGRGRWHSAAVGSGAEMALRRRNERGFSLTPFAGIHVSATRNGGFTERKEDGATWHYNAAVLREQYAEAGLRLQKDLPCGPCFTLHPALEFARTATLHRRNGTTSAGAYGYRGGSCGTAPAAQAWRAEAALTLRCTAGYSLRLSGGAEKEHRHRAYYANADVRVDF